MTMILIIVGSVFLTGMVALFISRNVEHGEARFGPDGQLPPYEPPVRDRSDMKVSIKQGSKIDE
ncbi:hypothetical protein [Qipengyuania mesophila]|uniref:Uncharacterized protein n=1 Tax=Qipengyuania mesophila TaxID=2867246 RepID=A0ABS7JWP5_9SPHN|nr:hypothetical protein [Qipengyuania mesophila]MBX7502081.1 hypothetical protein [Qipengyuania mesophila]